MTKKGFRTPEMPLQTDKKLGKVGKDLPNFILKAHRLIQPLETSVLHIKSIKSTQECYQINGLIPNKYVSNVQK